MKTFHTISHVGFKKFNILGYIRVHKRKAKCTHLVKSTCIYTHVYMNVCMHAFMYV